ncbi:hypothetical protein E4U42_000768 [Claviceps africana]|uniref:Uncharacterized protein n=1 Tax=Claviceps africana TaxID=83212 RepID=A0A8K0JAF8_9HYPO|nr:hypothetical protein E4U42_000768 [Claviceps africana]
MRISDIFAAGVMVGGAGAIHISWDPGYDRSDRSLTEVACSDGQNGLLRRFPAQGNVPGFPNIGGAQDIAGWNSPNCGTCWLLQYGGNSVKIVALDHAGSGFNIGQRAMDALTGGRAVEVGHVDAAVTQLLPRDCGL